MQAGLKNGAELTQSLRRCRLVPWRNDAHGLGEHRQLLKRDEPDRQNKADRHYFSLSCVIWRVLGIWNSFLRYLGIAVGRGSTIAVAPSMDLTFG